MITEELCQFAICDACGYKWQLQKVLPKKCRKCQTIKWNEHSLPAEIKSAQNSLPTSTSSNSNPPPKGKLSIDELRVLIEQKEIKKEEVIQDVEESWKFTNDKPEYHENGRVYRKQILAPEFKKTRTVRVDEEDHTFVID